MKSIEQYIREKLGRPDAPADVDADDLWAGIEQQLSPTDNDPVAGPWPWRGLFFALLFLVVGGLGGWLLSIGATDVDGTTTPEQTTALASSEQAQPAPAATELQGREAPAPTKSSVLTPSERPTSPQKTELVSVASSADEKAISSPPSPSNEPDAANLASKNSLAAPAAAPKKIIAIKKTPVVIQATANGDTDEYLVINDVTLGPEQSKANTETNLRESFVSAPPASKEIFRLPSLPFQTLSTTPIRFFPPVPTPPKFFKRTMNNHFSAGINTGANLLFTTYSASDEETDEDLNTAVKPAAGSSFGLNMRYQLSNKFALSTGLEYHRTLNTFEHVTSRDTMTEHPSAYNSGLIPAKLRRRVTDNLRTRYFTIPLLVHWNQTRGNFQLGVGAGVGLNFRQFANGTTLNANGEFVPFDAATGPATTPKTFLSYQFSPSAAYRLKPDGKLWLEAKANLNYLPFGTDPLSGTNRSSILTGFGLGIRYNL